MRMRMRLPNLIRLNDEDDEMFTRKHKRVKRVEHRVGTSTYYLATYIPQIVPRRERRRSGSTKKITSSQYEEENR